MKKHILTRIKIRSKHILRKTRRFISYCQNDVWNDTRSDWKVNVIKVINLSTRSFLNGDLQTKACAMTFRTLLAIVPALALVCAIGRGFGLQQMLMDQLINHLPSQAQLLRTAFGFVDSYLNQASGGIFVGVGILLLFWTLISLLRNIELTFNDIWQVPNGRSIWRMTTDYLAILIVLPILLACSSGISIFMSTSLSRLLPYSFMQPAIEVLFDTVGLMLTWLFFAGTYILLPNSKVRFKNAIIPGILVGTSVQVLQWLFISGQLYVAKYNAIYGSFSFLPLFLIWMQLVWLFTLIGGVLCYAMQNISEYNFGNNINSISPSYRRRTTVAVMAIIAIRFEKGMPSMTISQLAAHYKLPVNLIAPEVERLKEMNLVNFVDTPGKEQNERPLQPAIDVSNLTVGNLIDRLETYGSSDFIPKFAVKYRSVNKIIDKIDEAARDTGDSKKLIDLDICSPD